MSVVTAADTVQVEELTPAPGVETVALALCDLPHLCVLDSAECGGARGRYSVVVADPAEFHTGSFAALAESARRRERLEVHPGLPPFQTGYLGLFGYDLAREWEPTPTPRRDEFALPSLAVGRYDLAVLFDHHHGRTWAVAHPSAPRRELRQFVERLKSPAVPLRIPNRPPLEIADQYPVAGHPGVTSNFSRGQYLAAVRHAIAYVHAGDCFQVNLAQRLLAPLAEHPLNLWRRLRRVSPAPFGGYFDVGPAQLVSASPERFVEVDPRGEIATRPIKGTRPRESAPMADAAEARELLSNPKDRAENVMIVDLLRNDLGRVAEVGSVRVPRVCELESFRHVHHLVSEVRARLAAGADVWDLLRATLPGGSVTGAPKIRAMQIISELEPTARGAYCGSLGYLSFTGAADTNILIRTFTASRGYLQFPVGGGVVSDSDPAREYDETLHKAAGLLAALRL